MFSRDVYVGGVILALEVTLMLRQVVDQVLARVIQGFVRTMVGLGSILAVIGTSFPLFLVSLPPLAYIYRKIMLYAMSSSVWLPLLICSAVTTLPRLASYSA